jgi:hypothetical protein
MAAAKAPRRAGVVRSLGWLFVRSSDSSFFVSGPPKRFSFAGPAPPAPRHRSVKRNDPTHRHNKQSPTATKKRVTKSRPDPAHCGGRHHERGSLTNPLRWLQGAATPVIHSSRKDPSVVSLLGVGITQFSTRDGVLEHYSVGGNFTHSCPLRKVQRSPW